MPTPAERQAIAFLATVAVLGGGVRMVQARAFDRALQQATAEAAGDAANHDGHAGLAASAIALERQLSAVTDAREAKKKSAQKKSGPPDTPIDVDVASAEELDALPRVGPALAARIVANRDSLGPFGSLQALQRVKGIGPALATGLSPYVTFSSGLRPLHDEASVRRPP
jgi:competence protein ComEA